MPLKITKKLKNKNAFSLKKILHEKIAGVQEARPMHNIHASDVTKGDKEFCPREYCLVDITGKKRRDEFIGTSLRTTFHHGEDLQRRINEVYLEDIMVGNWVCRNCGEIKQLCRKPTKGHCFTKSGIDHNWQYEEPRPLSKISGISGGIDALIITGEPKYRIYEIKTMASDAFKALVAPLAEHRIRTNLYMRLVAEDTTELHDRVNTEVANILYVCKGFGCKDESLKLMGLKDAAFSPFKEFTVHRDDSTTLIFTRKAKLIKKFRGNGKMPDGVCNTSFCKRAKTCPVVSECFSGKYPAQITWNKKET